MPIVDNKEGKLCEYRDYVKLEAENARLKAEVERLTKAGDAMADMVDWEVPYERRKKLEAEWNAAKEGNGQP
jgi:hypothetical protein